MNQSIPLTLLTIATLLTLATPVAADPPGTCLFGYNPDSLSNVCYSQGPGTPVHTGSVGSGPAPVVCPIGNICTPPTTIPTYDPSGGTTVTVPAAPVPTYIEVLGIVVYPLPPTPCDSGTANQRVACWSDLLGVPNCGGSATNRVDCLRNWLLPPQPPE
ncbi:MAG: hypothetical protein QOG31_1250 [Thermoplasmata archaeon]|jgi:hypothetical protein|nr:hypothetical protein [Thermoplasmata archaeon]